MGGMGSLYIGASGLQTSQSALNTTAQNLANVSTPGYTRQLLLQADRHYNTIKFGAVSNQQVGLGTKLADVYQCRDYFLDKSYRLEAGRSSYYSTSYNTYYEIETLFGETEGVEFSDSLEKLLTAFQELQKTPDDTTIQTNLKQQSVEFVNAAKSIYDGLVSYQSSLNGQVIDGIDKVNTLAQKIYELNKEISYVEAGSQEHANDLRDQRNKALDELSGLIKISYNEDENGNVTVKAEGIPLVTATNAYTMGYTVDESTGFATPVWSDFGNMPVYDLSQPISSSTDTDVGELKSLLVQRGEKQADYTDLPQKSTYMDSNGNWLKDPNGWEVDGKTYYYGKEAYEAAANYYDTYTSKSSITSTMAQFDTLINGIIKTVNDLLCPNKTETFGTATTLTAADGSTINVPAGGSLKVLDMDKCSYGANGSVGTELFSRVGVERYKVYSDGTNTYYVYNEENESNPNTMYNIANLQVNDKITKDVSALPVYNKDKSVNYALAKSIVDAWGKGFANLAPGSSISYNFSTYYNALIGELANNESTANSLKETAQSTLTSIDNSRQLVVGVSSDEELSNMIRFQNAYNASSRYINVINDMLGTLINSMGAR